MSISTIAHNALVESAILPSESIAIERLKNSNWDGKTRIIIHDGENDFIEHQLGLVCQESHLTIYVIGSDRGIARTKCYEAGEIVFKTFSELSQNSNSGVLSISRESSGINPIGDRPEFEAFRSFSILNSLY
jgi:hypothetical protein